MERMVEAKRNRLNQLVEKLGMVHELKPLLESGENDSEVYGRFEQAIVEILDSYEGKRPPIFYFKGKSRSFEDFSKAVEPFKKRYGIGCEPAISNFDLVESVRGEYVESDFVKYYPGWGETPEEREKSKLEYKNRNKRSFSGRLIWRINEVVSLLQQKHKRDIWYKTL